MSGNDGVKMGDTVGLLLEADRDCRAVRITIRASSGCPKMLMEGRPVRYRLSDPQHSVVLAAEASAESNIRIEDIERVELL